MDACSPAEFASAFPKFFIITQGSVINDFFSIFISMQTRDTFIIPVPFITFHRSPEHVVDFFLLLYFSVSNAVITFIMGLKCSNYF